MSRSLGVGGTITCKGNCQLVGMQSLQRVRKAAFSLMDTTVWSLHSKLRTQNGKFLLNVTVSSVCNKRKKWL